MRQSQNQQRCWKSPEQDSAVAKVLAPEDVEVGDFVAILHDTCELPSFFWCADVTTLPAQDPVRIRFLPGRTVLPLRVESICLPFVLIKLPGGRRRTIDVRSHQLARLDRRFAKACWRASKKRKAKGRRH